jgi:hypothetical protein
MNKLANKIIEQWQTRLQDECAGQSTATQISVVQWLVGENQERFAQLTPEQTAILAQSMDYRYRILV